jgi:hypothetical protein
MSFSSLGAARQLGETLGEHHVAQHTCSARCRCRDGVMFIRTTGGGSSAVITRGWKACWIRHVARSARGGGRGMPGDRPRQAAPYKRCRGRRQSQRVLQRRPRVGFSGVRAAGPAATAAAIISASEVRGVVGVLAMRTAGNTPTATFRCSRLVGRMAAVRCLHRKPSATGPRKRQRERAAEREQVARVLVSSATGSLNRPGRNWPCGPAAEVSPVSPALRLAVARSRRGSRWAFWLERISVVEEVASAPARNVPINQMAAHGAFLSPFAVRTVVFAVPTT